MKKEKAKKFTLIFINLSENNVKPLSLDMGI